MDRVTVFRSFRLSRRAGAAVILSLLLALSASLAGCAKDAGPQSQPSETPSIPELSEAAIESEPESSAEESRPEKLISDEKLELIRAFAKDVYGSDSVNDLTDTGVVERDGETYLTYSFTNARGETVRLQLADDAETSGRIFLYENEGDTDVVRAIIFGKKAYIGGCVDGEASSDADCEKYAEALAAAFSNEKAPKVEYAGEVIADGRLLKLYSVSDGTGIAFDDRLGNACFAASIEGEPSFTEIVENDGAYGLNTQNTFHGVMQSAKE